MPVEPPPQAMLCLVSVAWCERSALAEILYLTQAVSLSYFLLLIYFMASAFYVV